MDTIEITRQTAERLHYAVAQKGADPWQPYAFACAEALRRSIAVEKLPTGDARLRGARASYDPGGLTTEEQATIDALNAEQAKLESDYQDADELPDDVDQRLGEIEQALKTFEDRPVLYDPAEITRAGVFISIDSEGRLSVDQGYVRPEDDIPTTDLDVEQGADPSSAKGLETGACAQRTVIAVAGRAADADEDDEDAAKPLPDRLIAELTAHRTLALRDALAENPATAFQAVLHNFVLTAFYRFASSGSCLEIGLHTPTFPAQAPGLRESASAKAVEARHESWKARLPKSEKDLWDALTAFDGGAQASLFAHCAERQPGAG
jgi:ParB family chromosome partitioning protein